jgi:tetratricopeptide (TPR) repeat protein
MAQPATNPKIEELRFKLKTDPKSRLFYQLAEELRRAGQFEESERVLRTGLTAYPAYLAAWVSLGRVLRELKNDSSAVEALTTSLQLDPGNVVAARLLADAYLALGDKVEAVKKYKLVHALLPSDETLNEQIASLERDLEGPKAVPPPPEPIAVPAEPAAEQQAVEDVPQPLAPIEESPFDRTTPPFAEAAEVLGERMRVEEATGDVEPMSYAHEESPFEEPVQGFSEAALEIEAPAGMHIAAAPVSAEVPALAVDDLPAMDSPLMDSPLMDMTPPFEAPLYDSPRYEPDGDVTDATPSEPAAPEPFATEFAEVAPATDAADTITMADLYARQGLIEDARHIYENILSRDPENGDVRAKLEAITPRVNPKIAKLEHWLARVSKREVGSV